MLILPPESVAANHRLAWNSSECEILSRTAQDWKVPDSDGKLLLRSHVFAVDQPRMSASKRELWKSSGFSANEIVWMPVTLRPTIRQDFVSQCRGCGRLERGSLVTETGSTVLIGPGQLLEKGMSDVVSNSERDVAAAFHEPHGGCGGHDPGSEFH